MCFPLGTRKLCGIPGGSAANTGAASNATAHIKPTAFMAILIYGTRARPACAHSSTTVR